MNFLDCLNYRMDSFTNNIVKTANEIKLEGVFSEKLNDFLVLLCLHNCTSIEFLLCPLITSLSHLMQQAKLKAIRTMSEGNFKLNNFYSLKIDFI